MWKRLWNCWKYSVYKSMEDKQEQPVFILSKEISLSGYWHQTQDILYWKISAKQVFHGWGRAGFFFNRSHCSNEKNWMEFQKQFMIWQEEVCYWKKEIQNLTNQCKLCLKSKSNTLPYYLKVWQLEMSELYILVLKHTKPHFYIHVDEI